jgi:hypothetical protein
MIVLASSTLLSGVRANGNNPLINQSNSSNYLYGWFCSGSHSESIQNLPGMVSVSCNGNYGENCVYFCADSSSPYGGVTGQQTVEFIVQFNTGSVSSSVSGSAAWTYVYFMFIDATTGQILYQSTSKSWTALGLLNGIDFTQPINLTNGHNYELRVGPEVKTGNSGSSAQAGGTINLMKVTY